jgi:hypothetical protein
VVRCLALVVVVVLAAAAAAGDVAGQGGADGTRPPSTGLGGTSPLTVHLVTVGPGDAVWERFGHNAIWIHDARTGQDIWWNWGLFTFEQEGFLLRLVKGEMLYSMGGREMAYELAQYRAQGRDVWAQELDLSAAQAAELDRLVRTNALPANRDYIYDYYEDNCSTRVRDALDAVLDGALKERFADEPAGTTWRRETRRHVEISPLTDAGIALVLGSDGDRAISAWQSMFLPLELRARIADVRLPAPGGGTRPLVRREFKVVEAGRPLPPGEVGPLWDTGLLVGLVAALFVAGAGWLGGRLEGVQGAGWVGRLLGAAPVGVWSVLAGVAGLVLVGAYFTDHDFWTPNVNVLLFSPLSLVVAVLALAAPIDGRLLSSAAQVARWTAALALLALAVEPLPWFVQANAPALALAVPVHLATAWALHILARDRRAPA